MSAPDGSPSRSWLSQLGGILRRTGIRSLEDGIPARGAALSYYVLLSLGPLLVLLVGVLEFFLTEQQVREGVVEALRGNVSARAAETVATVLERVEVPDMLAPESLLTLLLLVFGATAVFANVRGSLNAIWGIEPEEPTKREIALDLLRARVRGFVMILLTGLVLGISFLATSIVGWMSTVVDQGIAPGWLVLQATDAGVSLLLTGLVFGAIYRTLPSERVEWSTIWVGAFVTALFFVIGKSLVTWLIASASWTSYYGPGASVVAFLAWIYFSAQLFFVGAEFTREWSRARGGVMRDA